MMNPSRTQSAQAPPTDGIKVLLIEPDPDNCDVAVTILRSRGFQVVPTATREEGVERALQERPSVIVTELFERTERGWRVLELLRGMQALADIPVIAYSAYALPEDREAALTSGATLYLAKPLPPEALEEAVEAVLGMGQ